MEIVKSPIEILTESTIRRFVVVCDHPTVEGVTSFDLRASNPEMAARRAIVGALQYFRDDEFTVAGPTEIPIDASDADVDRAVETLCVEGPIITIEEAFGRGGT